MTHYSSISFLHIQWSARRHDNLKTVLEPKILSHPIQHKTPNPSHPFIHPSYQRPRLQSIIITHFPAIPFQHHLRSRPSHLRVIIQTIPSNPSRQLHILLHNRHSLRMYRQQIRILKQMHQVRLRSFLQCHQCLRLKPYWIAGT